MDLQLRIPPEEAKDRFRSVMAHVKSVLFTPTWRLRGDFVGNVRDNTICMRVRHGYSNGYAPLLFGRVEPTSYGSRIRIVFRPTRLVVVTMTVVWYGILIPPLVYFFNLARYALAGRDVDWGRAVAETGGIFMTLALLYVIEVIAKRIGKKDEARMRRRLDELFRDVRVDPPAGIEPL
jgi:hypothetical protein